MKHLKTNSQCFNHIVLCDVIQCNYQYNDKTVHQSSLFMKSTVCYSFQLSSSNPSYRLGTSRGRYSHAGYEVVLRKIDRWQKNFQRCN